MKDIRGEDAISIFMKAMHSKEVRNFDFFVALVWEIWNRRNKVTTEGGTWSPEELVA